MNTTDKPPLEKRGGSNRGITVTLSLPTVISGAIMLCAGFIGVFSLGILLGRGHNIESRIPQLERIMPQAAHQEQPKVIAQGEMLPTAPGQGASDPNAGKSAGQDAARGGGQPSPQGTPPAAGQTTAQNPGRGSGPASAPGAPQPSGQTTGRSGGAQSGAATPLVAAGTPPPAKDARNQVMDQGDLGYRDSLKQNTKPIIQRPASAKSQQTKGKADAAAQAKQPQAESAAKNQTFNYVYQVAAYKEADMSDKLAAKLKAAGVKARTEKSQENGGTWYKTVVDFRGTPDDTDKLRAKLKPLGFSRLILKSKVPIQ